MASSDTEAMSGMVRIPTPRPAAKRLKVPALGERFCTIWGDRKLTAKKPVILENGSRVRVGNLELTFYTAQGFKQLIQQRAIG